MRFLAQREDLGTRGRSELVSDRLSGQLFESIQSANKNPVATFNKQLFVKQKSKQETEESEQSTRFCRHPRYNPTLKRMPANGLWFWTQVRPVKRLLVS